MKTILAALIIGIGMMLWANVGTADGYSENPIQTMIDQGRIGVTALPPAPVDPITIIIFAILFIPAGICLIFYFKSRTRDSQNLKSKELANASSQIERVTTNEVATVESSTLGPSLTPVPPAPSLQGPSQIKPWLRFWARHFDYILYVFILTLILFLITPQLLNKLFFKEYEWVFVLFLIFLWVFMEAVLISKWETTLGKWLLSISIKDQHNNKIDYNRSFERAIKVYWRGMGIGFPIAFLITQVIAFNKLKKNGMTTWDSDDSLIVHHGKLSPMKVLIVVLTYLSFSILCIKGVCSP